jgi:hypothetical protein
MSDHAANFLDLLSRIYGLEGLTLDERSCCCLEISGRLEIQIEWDSDLGVIFLTAPLSPVPEMDRENLFAALLKANFLFRGTTGEALSLDPESGRLMLCLQFDPGSVAPAGQEILFRNFIATGERWRSALRDYSQEDRSVDQLDKSVSIPMIRA